MDLPERSGVALASGSDVVTQATTDELLAWLRGKGVAEAGLRDVEAMDKGFGAFQRVVLRYGLVRALLEKGHRVERDEALWAAFDAAMRARVEAPRRN